MGNQSMRSWRTQIQKLQTSLWLGDAGRISAGLITRFCFLKIHRPRIIWMDSIAINVLFFQFNCVFFWGGQAKMIKPRSRSWWIQAVNRETGRRVTGPGRSRRLFFDVVYGWWMGKWIKMMFFTQTVGKNVSGFRVKNGEHVQVMHVFYCFLLFFPAHFFGEKQHGDITTIIYLLRLRPTISRPGTLWSLIFWRHKTTRACTRSFMFESGMSIWAAFKAFKLC